MPPNVDIKAGFFFSADTLGDLAKKIMMQYQRVPMPPEQSRTDRGALQFLRRFRRRRRLRQAKAAAQDRDGAVLCRVGDACGARHPRRPPYQRQVPSHGHERPCDRRASIAAANPQAASASTAWRAPPARATSPAGMPLPSLRATPVRGRARDKRTSPRYGVVMSKAWHCPQ